MVSLWRSVRALQGQTLSTVGGHAFDVTAVNDGSIEIVVSSGRMYRIYRHEFDKAEELGMVRIDVRPQQLRDAKISEGRPAYVAGIIQAIVRQRSPEPRTR